MDERLREYAVSIYPLYVMGAEDEYGSSAIVVISEQPGSNNHPVRYFV